MIPHASYAALPKRKWNAAVCTLETQALIGESRAGCVGKRIVIDPLGRPGSPACWKDVDPIIGMLLEQGDDSLGQFRRVLFEVLRIDRIYGLVLRKRVRPEVSGDVSGRHLVVDPRPSGNRSIAVCRALCAKGRKRTVERCRF